MIIFKSVQHAVRHTESKSFEDMRHRLVTNVATRIDYGFRGVCILSTSPNAVMDISLHVQAHRTVARESYLDLPRHQCSVPRSYPQPTPCYSGFNYVALASSGSCLECAQALLTNAKK